MKVIVKFSPQIGLGDLLKEVSPSETVQNLEILISLNYERMNECKLVYQGKALINKAEVLRNIMNATETNEVTVTAKSEIEAYAQKVGSMMQLFQQYPTYFVGGLVLLIFLILFLMGGS